MGRKNRFSTLGNKFSHFKEDHTKIPLLLGKSAQRLARLVKRVQMLTTLYACLVLIPELGSTTYSSTPPYAELCPRSSICSENLLQVVMISFSRVSAYYMFPQLTLVFLTKCYKLVGSLQSSVLSIYLPFEDLHLIHVNAGLDIAKMSLVHTVFHVARWILRKESKMIFTTTAGRTGVLAFLCFIPVVGLMGIERIKKRYSFEIRKSAHYLAIPGTLALCYHTHLLAVVLTTTLIIYGIDVFYRAFYNTERVDTSMFTRLGSGTQLTFKNPAHFDEFPSGYVSVCIPWINKNQWHPFSIYAHHEKVGYSCVFIMAAGDWTKKLHESVKRNSNRPVWISGPLPSPYEAAVNYDNLILCASGIGITPAIGTIRAYTSAQRSVSLIWMCRDNSLIEFFLEHFEFSKDAINLIYYTGKKTLNLRHSQSHVRIIPGRPDLKKVIKDVIKCVEMKKDLPESLTVKADEFLDDMEQTYSGIANTEFAIDAFLLVARRCHHRGTTAQDIEAIFFPEESDDNGFLGKEIVEGGRGEGTGEKGVRKRKSMMMMLRRASETAKPSIISKNSLNLVDFSTRILSLAGNTYSPSKMDVVDIMKSMKPDNVCQSQTHGSATDDDDDDSICVTRAQMMSFMEKNVFLYEHDHGSEKINLMKRQIVERRQREETVCVNDVLDTKEKRKSWGVCYCGGAKVVEESVRSVSTELDIEFRIESFNW